MKLIFQRVFKLNESKISKVTADFVQIHTFIIKSENFVAQIYQDAFKSISLFSIFVSFLVKMMGTFLQSLLQKKRQREK